MVAELEALVLQYAGQNPLGVALTGSQARGDVQPGSDIDVWVLREGPPETNLRDSPLGPVTLFFEPPALLHDEAHLSRVDVAQLRVLADPHQLFAQLQHRPQRRRDVRALRKAALAELRRAHAPARADLRLFVAREAVLLAALSCCPQLTHPKLRHFLAALPEELQLSLLMALGLEPADEAVIPLAEAAQAPAPYLRKLRSGAIAEGTLQVLNWLTRDHVLPREALGEDAVGYLADRGPAPLRALWAFLHRARLDHTLAEADFLVPQLCLRS